MPRSVEPSREVIEDVSVLVRAHHPLIVLRTRDDARAENIAAHVALAEKMDLWHWRPHRGLFRPFFPDGASEDTREPLAALRAILEVREPSIFDVGAMEPFLESSSVASQLAEIHERFFESPAALIFRSQGDEVPAGLETKLTWVDVGTPSSDEWYQFANSIIKELRDRMPLRIEVGGGEVAQLVSNLNGLTLYEAKKILSQVVVESGGLTAESIARVAEAKRERLLRSASFEFQPAPDTTTPVAGLSALKGWLEKRGRVFQDPARAREFGLTPPRGLLLLGVQGCGKSLCAKAISAQWKLPLLRFDPARIYQPYLGRTEESLRRAMEAAEAMAPVVFWIDELEKAFAQGRDDGGTSQRVLGTFLHWLQEKPPGVFVVATSNDISELPPELLRKGRFDEIFFVDLPEAEARAEIVRIHMERRGHDPSKVDLNHIASVSDGFSGAELEQAVLSALYRAFAGDGGITTELLEEEIRGTRPLSVVRRDAVTRLRAWAKEHAVPADGGD